MVRSWVLLAWLAGIGVAVAQPCGAQAKPKLAVTGDIRFRLEDDWDSRTPAGALRPDRARARIRARLAAALDLGDGFKAMARVRTAADGSQQNANVTFADFSGNNVDRLNVIADRYSVAWQRKLGGVEVGRMPFPFFTQNEYFWDGDIDPLGAVGNLAVSLGGSAKLKLNMGAFRLPVGHALFSGALYAGQAVFTLPGMTFATGLFRFDADLREPDRLLLLDGNGGRGYAVLAINGQYVVRRARLPPLTMGVDFYRNLQGYGAAADAVSRSNDDQRTGYVFSAAWGDTAAARHFQVGYRYFHIEKLAVDSSYSHDDVARLGTPAQADLTDLKGSDVFANYAVTKRLTLGMRTMFTHRITNVEDDRRTRFDLVYSF